MLSVVIAERLIKFATNEPAYIPIVIVLLALGLPVFFVAVTIFFVDYLSLFFKGTERESSETNTEQQIASSAIHKIRASFVYSGLILIVAYLIYHLGVGFLAGVYANFIEFIKTSIIEDAPLAYFANRYLLMYMLDLRVFFEEWGQILFLIGVAVVIIGAIRKIPVPSDIDNRAVKAALITYSILGTLGFIAFTIWGVGFLNLFLCKSITVSGSNLYFEKVSYQAFIGGFMLTISTYLFTKSVIKVVSAVRSFVKESRTVQQ